MLRLVHTSDWYLGHRLHGLERAREHRAFLDWLIETCVSESADALLIAGDVFDTANPSAAAQRCWFDFLGRLRQRLPALDVVAIAGNHDSPARLGAPAPLLGPLGMHVVGAVRRQGETVDASSLIAPLHDPAPGPGR
jgi:exonuclease SbcD